MPRLMMLNGPPGCGKSTVALMYVQDHPLALNLDIDRLRGMIGRWRDNPRAAGLLARAIGLAAARAHLAGGHDVVVPQFVGRPEFLRQVEQLARGAGATFREVVLLDTKENVLRRFAERSRRAAEPAHLEAQEMLNRHGGDAALSAMYDDRIAVIADRPAVRVVRTVSGQVEKAYQDFLTSLE